MLFINFRVGDGNDMAAWLDAELSAVFGEDQVFRSSRSIVLGRDYEPPLWDAVENCSAMVAVIGERWLTEFGGRLFEPDDIVRREIATVLAAGKPVIPVLAHTGPMHRASELPEDLAGLAKCQYVRLTYRDRHVFPGLINRLITDIPELGIGVRDGIKDLASWSREQSLFSGSELPADLVLLGREDAAENLRSWLTGPAGNLVIQGQTVDEVAAFAAAVLHSHDPHHRAVLLTSEAGWDHAAKIPAAFPAVVISDSVPVRQTQNTRHVIIARDGFEARGDSLVLPRIPRDQARDAFLAQGMALHQADEHAGLVRRSFRAVTRRLHPNQPRPAWTRTPDSALAAPLVLVGRWSATNEADHAVIAHITGNSYAEVDRFVTAAAASEDPLVHRSGSRWQLADPYDGWTQLRALVTATDMRLFMESAIEVLSEIDPVLELPDPEVTSAGIKGIRRIWSDELREGLAHGLARLGDAGTAVVGGEEAATRATHIVVQLLRKANEDRTGLLWRSLSDVLPLLAEAGPRAFLDAADLALRGERPLLRTMFEDEGDRRLHRHSAHTGLLWALETLLWNQEHRGRAVLLLARLAEVDPGGRLSTRPAQSLVNALTVAPVSPVPLDRRSLLINQVRAGHPKVGWQLLMDLTEPNGFLLYPARPKVRIDWTGAEQGTLEAATAYRDDVLSAVLADLAAVPRRWAEFLQRMPWLPAVCRDRFLAALEALDTEMLGAEETRALWEEGNKIVRHESGAAELPRNLSPEQLTRLSTFLDGIEPDSDPTRHAWLFGWHPDLPGIDRTDLDRHRAVLDERQREVVAEEFARHGIDSLVRLAAASDRGNLVGWTLAQVAGDTVRDEVFAVLGTEFADGWVRCRARDGGRDWITGVVAAVPEETSARTAFLFALPVNWAAELVAEEAGEVQDHFWMLTPAFPYPDEDPEKYLAEILAHDRPAPVVDALSLAFHGNNEGWRPSADLIEAAFDGLLNFPQQINSHTAFAVERLLTYRHIAGHDLHSVAWWEVAFNGLFHDRQPRALLELISNDPSAFVELHQFRYLPTEKLNPKALQFYLTGERLRCIPGQTGEQVDRAYLLGWVQNVREIVDEIGMRRSGDRAVGSLISAGPNGEDGAWPVEAVRDVLELPDAQDLREGFGIGLANNSGVSIRGVYDGGQQEREEAARYIAWADAVEGDWPQTAQILREHAEYVLSQGKHWDREAEEDHDE